MRFSCRLEDAGSATDGLDHESESDGDEPDDTNHNAGDCESEDRTAKRRHRLGVGLIPIGKGMGHCVPALAGRDPPKLVFHTSPESSSGHLPVTADHLYYYSTLFIKNQCMEISLPTLVCKV